MRAAGPKGRLGVALLMLALAPGATALAPGAAGALTLAPPSGAVAGGQRTAAFDQVAIALDRLGPEGGARTMAGRVRIDAFALPADGRTPAALAEAVARTAPPGVERAFACVDDACGGVDARFALEILPAPAMRLDTADMAIVTLRDGDDGGEGEAAAYAMVVASRVVGRLFLQITAVVPEGAPARTSTAQRDTDPDGPVPGATGEAPAGGGVDGVEAGLGGVAAGSAAGVAAQTGDVAALRARLLRDGHLPLEGLDFDSGTARMSTSSADTIEAAAALLAASPGMTVWVVGHSDTSGDLLSNIALSRERARAVFNALVERGISADRLSIHAVGPLAPLTSNAAPEGRAVNRRVELVLVRDGR
ncbi:MAG: OmpA family protein [Pseudomonadota bacterium]